MMKFLSFDIETAKITPPDEDIQAHRPLGIACWAVAWQHEKSGDIVAQSGFGIGQDGSTLPRMTQSQCRLLVARLNRAVHYQHFTILAHNGVSFDFDILAEESGMHDICAELAMNSVDPCLMVHCMRGYPVGLEAICKGFGLQGKTEGMSGALAPQMWADGQFDEVLEYVKQDVRATLEVALEIEKRKRLMWVSKSGRRKTLPIPKLLTAQEALQLPEPDTSWMDTPIPRSRFTEWMEAQRA